MILFGLLFAIFERSDFNRSIVSSRYFWHGLVFTSLFNIAVVYAIIHYPDWMWMYYLENPQNTTAELVYLFAFLYYLPYMFGFYLGFDLKKRSAVLWVPVALGLIATEGWLIHVLFDRYSVIGTRQDFYAKTAISLFSPENPIGPVMNGAVAAMVVYYVFVFILYRKTRRKSLSL